jgi:ABC-2 type transport system permease protein
MSTHDTGVTGVIHDIGYQHYDGPRLGRGYSARALYLHSVRSAYGLGRSAWAKVLPIGILGFASIASLILVVVNTQLPAQVIDYVGIASTFTYAATAFVAVVAPELVSVDLRSNLLQLYLSRPLRRRDYALTKLAALATAVFILFAIPMLIMFLGMAFNTDTGITGVFDELGGLAKGLVAAAIHGALLAALGLPIAALSGRRVFASGLIIALFLLTAPVSVALQAFGSGALENLAGLINPSSLLNGVDQWVFGPGIGITQTGDYGVVYALVTAGLIALGTFLAVLRYKKVKS